MKISGKDYRNLHSIQFSVFSQWAGPTTRQEKNLYSTCGGGYHEARSYYLMPFVSYAFSDLRNKVTKCFKITIFIYIANRWLEFIFAITFLTFYSHVHVSFSSFWLFFDDHRVEKKANCEL